MKTGSASPSLGPPVLAPGRNCWTVCAADHSGLLIDARAYYKAFHAAAAQARGYLLIAGWRFNSDIRLVRGPDAGQGGEEQFLPFLDRLCERNPDLHVYLLAWDFSINYAPEWELFQKRKFEHGRHQRVHFCFDAAHAVGGSHHQKLVVVDGRIAFVGGLDFSSGSWDDRDHRAVHPERVDSGQEPHDLLCRKPKSAGPKPHIVPSGNPDSKGR
jgi:phospholipase D1/2